MSELIFRKYAVATSCVKFLKNKMNNRPLIFPYTRLAVVIAVFIYLAYVVARNGLDEAPNILPLLLSLSIILLPAVLQRYFKLPISALQLAVLIFFFAFGWISILLDADFSIILYLTSLIGIYFFLRNISLEINNRTLVVGLMNFFLAIKLISIVWSQVYLEPLAPEAYAVGNVHLDTLFLAGLTSMIKTYSTVSTGLFGLEPIHYHAGSNFLFASFAQLSKLSVLQFYNFGFPVIFIPLFIQTFFYAVFSNFKTRPHSIRTIICLIILFFALSGFVNDRVGNRYLLPSTLNSHFLSQSYCISLILTYLFIAIYAPFLKRQPLHQNRHINTLLILLIPALIFLIGYTKVSTAILLFTALVFVVIRTKLIFQSWVFVSLVLTSFLLLVVMFLTVEKSDKLFQISMWSFYKTYVDGSLLIYFLLNYCWMVFLFVSLFFLARITGGSIYKNLITGKYIVIETLLLVALVGIMPGLFINIAGGSAIYFSDIQYWFTLIVFMNIASHLLYKYYRNHRRFFPNIKIVAFLLLVIIVRDAVFRSLYYFAKGNIWVRTALVYNKNTYIPLVEIYSDHPVIKLNESEKFKAHIKKLNLRVLESLRNLPIEVKREALIYCEDLSELNKFLDCTWATFYLTSLTEIALINGLYWKDCFPHGEYSMIYYSSAPKEIDKETAFQLAKKKGFDYVIVLNLTNSKYDIVHL